MPPALALDPWWTAHLQLPGYDPIATAGTWHCDLRAAEQAQVFVTQALDRALSPWEQAIVCNLWGWRQADGQRRYATVYAEPYRPEALALWSVALGLWLLLAAPPRRAPQVTVAYAQATRAAVAYAHVVAAITRVPAWRGPSCSCPGARPSRRHGVADSRCTTTRPWLQAKCCCAVRAARRFSWRWRPGRRALPTVAPIAAVARQALTETTLAVLPAFL